MTREEAERLYDRIVDRIHRDGGVLHKSSFIDEAINLKIQPQAQQIHPFLMVERPGLKARRFL